MRRIMCALRPLLAWLVVVSLAACQDGRHDGHKQAGNATPQRATAREVTNAALGQDLPALPALAQSLEPLRSAFNAGKGEARFIALLSPT